MKYLALLIIGFIVLNSSCSKTATKKVTYIATGAISEYSLQYVDENNELTKIAVTAQSAQDRWNYNYITDDGEIVYLSGNYKDINSALKIMILIDGKIYKQASNEGDTLKFITVSGTIPYE